MNQDGLSLVELIVTVAIAGTLFGAAAVVLSSNGVSTTQAARSLSAHLSQVRFEAIQSNRNAFLTIDTSGSGGYTMWVDEDENGTRSDGEVLEQVQFGYGDLSRLSMSVSGLSGTVVGFDRRGVPRGQVVSTVFTISSGNRSSSVALSSTGRPSLQ